MTTLWNLQRALFTTSLTGKRISHLSFSMIMRSRFRPVHLIYLSYSTSSQHPMHLVLTQASMQYHVFIIILHRPFVSKRGIQPYPPRGEGHMHARKMCLESAIEIARLLEAHESQFSLCIMNTQVVHMAFTGALILVYATISESDRQRHGELSRHLATCCRALAELGEIFENATRSLDTLLTIKRTWQARLVAGAGYKRRSSNQSASRVPGLRKKIKGFPRPTASNSQSLAEKVGTVPDWRHEDASKMSGASATFGADMIGATSDFAGISIPLGSSENGS